MTDRFFFGCRMEWVGAWAEMERNGRILAFFFFFFFFNSRYISSKCEAVCIFRFMVVIVHGAIYA